MRHSQSFKSLSRPSLTLRSRRGLSFVELTIGISITGVIMLALAGFTVSISKGWRNSDEAFKARNAAARSGYQMQDLMGGMLAVLQTKPGSATGDSAYIFYWQNDSNGAIADGKAQFGEMALIEYDPASKAVWLYKAKDASAMTTAQRTTAASDQWGDATSPAIVTYFKSSDIVAPRRAVVGGGVGASAGGVEVTSGQFGYFSAQGAKPLASFRVGLKDAKDASSAFGNVTLRSARSPSNVP